VVSMAVEDRRHGEARDRIFEPAAAQERVDVAGFSLDRSLDRRVVEQDHDVISTQARERGLELQRFVHGFVHELFDDLLAPRPERPAAEPPSEPLHAGKPDAFNLRRLAVEHDDAGVLQDPRDVGLLVGFVVVVAEDGDDRDFDRGLQFLDERARLFGEAVVGEITAERENIGGLADLREERGNAGARLFPDRSDRLRG